ncbi:hypothetical protein [Roseospira goensis]|uniref:Uncharacterized protein n=1 Tax=Roseospira goensis TaxID=391922 RepID=A0A7W6WKT3_9PROT|nr:hypothetical protein [Roseospira goensis]MBB4286124.1 hypothetical protein [Roseospira goensis]
MAGNASGHPDSDRTDMNKTSLLRLGLFGSIALLIASTLPPDLMVASLSSLLWIGALVSALVAGFLGEPVRVPHLTRWDEAAILMAISLFLGFFIDQQAMLEQVERMRG